MIFKLRFLFIQLLVFNVFCDCISRNIIFSPQILHVRCGECNSSVNKLILDVNLAYLYIRKFHESERYKSTRK